MDIGYIGPGPAINGYVKSKEDVDLAYLVSGIMKQLKEGVEKVAKAEFDNDWQLQKKYYSTCC